MEAIVAFVAAFISPAHGGQAALFPTQAECREAQQAVAEQLRLQGVPFVINADCTKVVLDPDKGTKL